jgi:DNA-binding CsgD family transcriptional regulator
VRVGHSVAVVTKSAAGASERVRRVADVKRLSHEGLDLSEFRAAALGRLRSLMSVDAAFFATVDPATLLFTSAAAEDPLAQATPVFLDNEFGRDDVNKFARLAGSADPVGSLDLATHGHRKASARYREVLAPLGLGDEVRLALVTGGICWGVLCLHRESGALGFDQGELATLRDVTPHLAEGLRGTIALFPTNTPTLADTGPGIIVLDEHLQIVSINHQAEDWLADIDWPSHTHLPMPVLAAAAELMGGTEPSSATPTRLRRGRGGWITVHASILQGATPAQVAVVLEAAAPGQVSSLVLAAHGLTPAQSNVAALVLQGRSTSSIVTELRITTNTLQEHLHAVFERLGVGSRRELIAALTGRPT